MLQPLTRRQVQVLRFLVAYQERESHSPAFWEIGKACGGIALSTVYDHLISLTAKGYITRRFNQRRAITILHDPDHPDVCPSCQRPFAESTT